ncbi:cupin domain-containing protein [Marinitoga aeolica]|uniref:Cupin domain-containing protein n=2 Tax=Marinitoga aeolica TaxID=2809031 RepID=A0ABY8PNQ9_9BACT|nr:cupin domain-containing protein [Marinitoga aeolica]WGS64280.1 cupin domain-containing protein [Marinitoga aeolica]
MEEIIKAVDEFFEKHPEADFETLELFLYDNFKKEDVEEYFGMLGEAILSAEGGLRDPMGTLLDNEPEVKIIENPSEDLLKKLDVEKWPIWEKEASTFDWYYDDSEVCYILEGEVVVHTKNHKYKIKKGDLVRFKKGLSCKWEILKDIKKHYNFGIDI